MAVRKKKTVKKAKAKKAPARKANRRAAKAVAKKTKSKKTAVKAKAAKRPAAKKAKVAKKKKTPAKRRGEYGEGNYKASKRFRQAEEKFIAGHRSEIPALGKAAEDALDGPEGDALRAAEAKAAGHAAGQDKE
jgi:hypothetical protein